MSDLHTPATTVRYCDRCKTTVTDGPSSTKALGGLAYVETVSTVRHLRWVGVTYRTSGPHVLESRVDFCEPCWEAWAVFIQGRAVEAVTP